MVYGANCEAVEVVVAFGQELADVVFYLRFGHFW